MVERTFEFLHHNEREEKPRERGITEIRGPTTIRWALGSYGIS
jgi:hypothetical protein